MTGKDQLSLASVVAVLASGAGLAPLTRDRTFLMLAGVLVLASAGIGAAVRRLVQREPVVRLLQLAPVLLLGWLVPETLRPVELAADTVVFIQQGSAPMPFHVGFAVFCVLLVWLSYLLVESLVNGADAPAWTFLPLITPFLITAIFGYLEAGPLLFALSAAGYGLLLAVHARSGIVGEPDRFGREPVTTQSWRRGIGRAATVTTVGAIALSLLGGFTLPASRLSASAPGAADVRFNDPSLDLIRNLNSPSNLPVISYRSTNPGGVNLRLAALPVLDDTGFRPGAPSLAAMPLPTVPGNAATVVTNVTVSSFSSEYLPVPWIPRSVDLPPRGWRWDQGTLAVVAVGSSSSSATRGLSYQVTSSDVPELDGTVGSNGTDPVLDDATTLSVPNGIAPAAYSLVDRLTAARTGTAAKALALRDYLLSDLFTYSTDRAPGTTLGTLNDFLFGSRTGYCEQFAGAMAVLARIAKIPSRVAVGFRPGTKTGDVWEVTPRDMHAWTELYVGGKGWLPVDATPASDLAVQPTASASPSPTPTRSSAAPTPTATADPTPPPAESVAPGGDPGALGIAALAVLGLAVVGFAPTLVRRLQRLRRLSGRGERPLEDAWDEVAAIARDRGLRWPPGSTRTVASALAGELDEPARSEFTALALAVEKERYAPVRAPSGPVSAQVAVIRTGLEARWPAWSTVLDRWWPRSLWPRSR